MVSFWVCGLDRESSQKNQMVLSRLQGEDEEVGEMIMASTTILSIA